MDRRSRELYGASSPRILVVFRVRETLELALLGGPTSCPHPPINTRREQLKQMAVYAHFPARTSSALVRRKVISGASSSFWSSYLLQIAGQTVKSERFVVSLSRKCDCGGVIAAFNGEIAPGRGYSQICKGKLRVRSSRAFGSNAGWLCVTTDCLLKHLCTGGNGGEVIRVGAVAHLVKHA
jgi:hypothetical protein